MKKLLSILIGLTVNLSLAQVNINTFPIKQINQYEADLENAVTLTVNYAGEIVISDADLEYLENNEITNIDLVYTQFKRNPDFDQQQLNQDRLNMVLNKFPFIEVDNINWQLVEQTEATTYEEAQQYFHGFVFHFKPKMEDYESIMLYDAFMDIEVKLPLAIDSAIFDAACIQQFSRLARKTGGEMNFVANSKDLTKKILKIIDEVNEPGLDLMLIIDKTSSMSDDFQNLKKGLNQLLNSLEDIEGIRLSIASYGDKNIDGRKWYDFFSFGHNFEHTRQFLNSIQLTGGGDFPESVYDGVYETFGENFWRSNSKRVAILLGDAPSLMDRRTTYTEKDIVELAIAEDIHMNFYPILLSPYSTIGNTVKSMEEKVLISEVYPNPTKGPFTVSVKDHTNLTCEVFNQSGELITTQKMNSNQLKIDLSGNPSGLYVVRVLDANKNFDVKKVILNK